VIFNNLRFQRYGDIDTATSRSQPSTPLDPCRAIPLCVLSSRRTDPLPAHSAPACIHVCTMVPDRWFLCHFYTHSRWWMSKDDCPRNRSANCSSSSSRLSWGCMLLHAHTPARLMLTRDALYVHVLYIQLRGLKVILLLYYLTQVPEALCLHSSWKQKIRTGGLVRRRVLIWSLAHVVRQIREITRGSGREQTFVFSKGFLLVYS
jgi:hypothetical protein